MMLSCLKIFNSYFVRLLICLFISIVTIHAQQADEINTEIRDYLKKVCARVPTCDIIRTVPEYFRTLRIRNCTCDEECPDYGDCCEDSMSKSSAPRTNRPSFECVKTVIDGSVYMITDCPAEMNSSDVIAQNCINRDTDILSVDILSSTPVTSNSSGRTYKNMFCALCNDEEDFEFWDILVTYDELLKAIEGKTKRPEKSAVTGDSILDTIQASSEGYNWLFKNNDANLTNTKCYLNASVPRSLSNRVRSCVPANVIGSCALNWTDSQARPISEKCTANNIAYAHIGGKIYKNEFCARCNYEASLTNKACIDTLIERPNTTMYDNFKTNITDRRILKIPQRCEQIPRSLLISEELCPTLSTTVAPQPASSIRSSCYPMRKDLSPPKPCLLNLILLTNDSRLTFVDNETAVIFENAKYRQDEEFFQSSQNDTIAICGTYVTLSTYSQIIFAIDDLLTSVLIKISVVCLFLQLLMFQQLPELRNLSGKNLACFSFAYMIAFISYDFGPAVRAWTGSCRIVGIILHYTLLNCFAWMLIMSYDCWLSLYRATVQFRTSAGKGHSVKFAVYCVISATLPLILVAYATYWEFSPVNEENCNRHPGYGIAENCFIFNSNALYYYFFLPASVSFLGNICFFAHTAYMIYLSQRKSVNPNTRNDFKLYTRLALMMGLTWTLGSIRYITGSEIIGLMFTIMNMSQGIFIFFGFTFKRKFIKLLLDKHKDNKFITITLSSFATPDVNAKIVSENKTETEAV